MRRKVIRRGRLVLGLWVVVFALVLLVAVGAARGGPSTRSNTPQRCTHGVSSIGPVEVVDGKVVSGSEAPDTQACLP